MAPIVGLRLQADLELAVVGAPEEATFLCTEVSESEVALGRLR